jgi:hypothetical protein
MKTILISLGLTFASIACAQDIGPVGRYQLATATVGQNSPNSAKLEHLLFRIDTMTGRVWKYNQFDYPAGGGKQIEVSGWVDVSENYAASVRLAEHAVKTKYDAGADPLSDADKRMLNAQFVPPVFYTFQPNVPYPEVVPGFQPATNVISTNLPLDFSTNGDSLFNSNTQTNNTP